MNSINPPSKPGQLSQNATGKLRTQLQQIGNFIWEVVKIVAISLAIIVPIRYFLIQPFYVKGSSMEPNFEDYQYLIIDEISYRLGTPARGQVIVLRDPQDTSQFFIKRLIGLPGDTVKITNGKVEVNDQPLNESAYLASDVVTTTPTGTKIVKLGNDQYYALGDNRSASYDSRRFGPIKRSLIVGRVWIRAWPFTKLTVFK